MKLVPIENKYPMSSVIELYTDRLYDTDYKFIRKVKDEEALPLLLIHIQKIEFNQGFSRN